MTALLLMDFQQMVVDSYAVDMDALLSQVQRLAVAARSSGAMVIHVIVGFQPGYPEVSAKNSVFSGLKAAGFLAAGDPAAEIHPEITPQHLDDLWRLRRCCRPLPITYAALTVETLKLWRMSWTDQASGAEMLPPNSQKVFTTSVQSQNKSALLPARKILSRMPATIPLAHKPTLPTLNQWHRR
jgi:hypothetical protein